MVVGVAVVDEAVGDGAVVVVDPAADDPLGGGTTLFVAERDMAVGDSAAVHDADAGPLGRTARRAARGRHRGDIAELIRDVDAAGGGVAVDDDVLPVAGLADDKEVLVEDEGRIGTGKDVDVAADRRGVDGRLDVRRRRFGGEVGGDGVRRGRVHVVVGPDHGGQA